MTSKTIMMATHNGSHRQPAYFEWWYFHFVDLDGLALNLVLHETDIFGQHHDPYCSISVLLPGQSPQYLRRPIAAGDISCGETFLSVGKRQIVEDAAGLTIELDFDDGNYFTAEITKLAPPLVIDEGVLYEEVETGRSSHWVVQIPHATFTGILQINGERLSLQGTAYHDHQWGTLLIQDFVSDWVWGHFADEHGSVVFFQINTRYGRPIERIAVIDDRLQLISCKLDGDCLDRLTMNKVHGKQAGLLNVSIQNIGMHFRIKIAPERVMRTRRGEQVNGGTANYFRWAANLESEDFWRERDLIGICEYLQMRPGQLSY